MNYECVFYGDLTPNQIKNSRKSRVNMCKNVLQNIHTIEFIDDELDESAYSKEFRETIEEARCQYIITHFDMWDTREQEYTIDVSYWI